MQGECIAAISTAPVVGGVAIIRISGACALDVASQMFVPAGKRAVKDFKPRYMYSGNILAEGGITDFGLCVYFRAPHSFTGEDVVEFHCHGGVQLSRAVLKRAFACGARAAKAGEFTMRAFLNGKISLSAAEGMADMINGQSTAEVRAGSLLYSGKLTKEARAVQDELKNILAKIGADVDYPEEDIERTELISVKDDIAALEERLNAFVAAYTGGKVIKNGVTVAICGRPNAGKSSLLNALLGYDKAIVSSYAGTTRDVVEGSIELGGIRFNFYDTAGIRETSGEVEREGIDRAKKTLASADLALIVYEGAFGKEERELVSECSCPVIKVRNKRDISDAPGGEEDVFISALTGEGIEKLKTMMKERALPQGSSDGAFIIEERHYMALKRAAAALKNAKEAAGVVPLDIISVDLQSAWDILGEITGETATEEIIDTIFSKFCVGK